MKILYYDCFSGISGDMNLAAMIALGVQPDYLRGELSKLGLDHEFSLNITTDARKGIQGTRVDVDLHHTHTAHGGAHSHQHHVHQNQRTLIDIESIIKQSGLDEQVKDLSLAIFNRVARAEAKIHGKSVHEVHFHEVGATDSLVDIVGAAICFYALKVDAVWSAPVELGGGFVNCAHGLIPVPAPATLEILSGIPTKRGAVLKETTTPTGAAILAELVTLFEARPEMQPLQTVYGIGHRDTDIPNVLRVSLAEVEEQPGMLPTTEACLLECNIDDMTGEALGDAMERLLAAGAMDIHFTPIIMKKNRPAVTLSLLCARDEEERFKRLIFRHTSTLGIKTVPLKKTALAVSFEQLETPLGTVTMKQGLLDGRVIRSKPELEDCRRLADAHGLSLGEVYLEIGKVRTV
nr:nickel pincer cofactor biosynthesis protein LarC [uncultured Desulfobulbus sp.]